MSTTITARTDRASRSVPGLFASIAFVAAAVSGAGSAGAADEKIYIPDIVELSGPGAVSGSNWRDGVILAVEEINAAGGILGRKIDVAHIDTQSNPGIARAQVQKALDDRPLVILGPVYSGSVLVTMQLADKAEVPEITGGEAAKITQLGSRYIFRTAFGQQFSMPKIANWIRDGLKAKSVAIVWVNNDFGKGGRDTFLEEMRRRGITVAADIATEQGQVDFSADVIKLKNTNADAVFVYTNEEESARFLRTAKQQGLDKPLVGETTLLSQKVIELAGDAAEGVRGHVGLSVDAPSAPLKAFGERFKARFGYANDHNGIKGYVAVQMVKYGTEKLGRFDAKGLAATLHGLKITPEDAPGILLTSSWDENGDIDRESFLGQVVAGKQKIVEVLPRLGK